LKAPHCGAFVTDKQTVIARLSEFEGQEAAAQFRQLANIAEISKPKRNEATGMLTTL